VYSHGVFPYAEVRLLTCEPALFSVAPWVDKSLLPFLETLMAVE